MSRARTTTLPLAPALVLKRAAVRLVQATLGWRDRNRSRTALGYLEPHLLRDIGLDDFTAQAELSKPFWRI